MSSITPARGKTGDQHINWAQNVILIECGHNGVDAHLIEDIDADEYVYCERIELVDKPYTETQSGVDALLSSNTYNTATKQYHSVGIRIHYRFQWRQYRNLHHICKCATICGRQRSSRNPNRIACLNHDRMINNPVILPPCRSNPAGFFVV